MIRAGSLSSSSAKAVLKFSMCDIFLGLCYYCFIFFSSFDRPLLSVWSIYQLRSRNEKKFFKKNTPIRALFLGAFFPTSRPNLSFEFRRLSKIQGSSDHIDVWDRAHRREGCGRRSRRQ
jgi:hypothetical protein